MCRNVHITFTNELGHMGYWIDCCRVHTSSFRDIIQGGSMNTGIYTNLKRDALPELHDEILTSQHLKFDV